MKQVNFSHSGGFPLEQETLERLQTAYRSELFEALKSHLSIEKNNNYIVAPATEIAIGWAIIHQYETDAAGDSNLEGILYPIEKGNNTGYLKTTRTGTNLTYGTGTSQTAYFDYEAVYISQSEFINGVSQNNDALTVNYYDLSTFKVVKNLQTIENILQSIEADIDLINQSYLPINGSKAMQGDLDLGVHKLSKLDIKESSVANVRVADFKLGSTAKRGLLHPTDPLGRALVDNSDGSDTNLTLNYASDWNNTHIGGKVYFDNVNTTSSNGSLLILDNLNQVIKSNTLIDSLLGRITALENKPASTVPIGMIAIWGKTAPFPEGWEEYVPLRGKMPVGFYNPTPEERSDLQDADGGNGITYYRDANGYPVYPFDTMGLTSGRIGKTLRLEELPPHTHTETRIKDGEGTIINYDAVGDDRHAGYESVQSGSTGDGKSFSILNPYRVVQFIEYTGRAKDTTAPTKPNLTVSSVSNTSVTLSWTSSDDFGVTNYVVYRSGVLPVTLGNVLSYTAPGLLAGTSYSFYVVAKDAAGNSSIQSDTVNATTSNVDTTKPTNFDGYSQGENAMYLTWTAPADPGVVSYEIWRRTAGGISAPRGTSSPKTKTFFSDTGSYETTYFYKVRSLHISGNYSAFTDNEVGITTDPLDIECFDVESLVTMASGQSKKLKNIVVGDKLQGFSFPNEIDESDGDYMIWNGKLNEATKAEVTVVNKMTSVQPNYYEIKTADTTIKVTAQHPLLVTEDGENVQWVCVKNVLQGMLLIDKTGKTKAIESIEFKEEPLEVALLDVENVDNYVISGIVAHNNKPLDPPVNP
jgi:hypothetical protein